MFLDLILLLSSIPVGFLIAWFARDELIQGRDYLFFLLILTFIGIIVFLKSETVVLTLGFICITAWISYLKSFDSKWAVIRKI